MKLNRLLSPLLMFVLLLSVEAFGQTEKPPAAKKITNNESAIRELYDGWAKAFKAHDLEGIMACYAPGKDVVAYDIIPPLQYVGHDAYRKDYAEFLAQFTSPIEVEFRDMRVVAGNDVAFVHTLERISGTMKNGQSFDSWIRATSGLRKIKGKWLIVHDHISAPVDLDTGKAVLNLHP
jgi:uncharacterized protein (TIGR02246 family)